MQQINQQGGCFTIGVIVDKSRVFSSKLGKRFAIVKLSDLNKYDLNLIQRVSQETMSKEDLKAAMASYTGSGYKQISFMCFGDELAKEATNYRSGTIVAIINPRVMQSSNAEHGLAYSLDTTS